MHEIFDFQENNSYICKVRESRKRQARSIRKLTRTATRQTQIIYKQFLNDKAYD